MYSLWSTVRQSIRALTLSPGFSITVVIFLAVGIASTTTVFGLLNSILFRDLPVFRPDRLVGISVMSSKGDKQGLSLPLFTEIERHQEVFSGMYAWWGDAVLNAKADGALCRADVWAVTGSFFSELRVRPTAGRLLLPTDVSPGTTQRVAVLGFRFWKRNFLGDPEVVGKIVEVEGVPFTILGIVREGFTGMSLAVEPDITIPITALPLVTTQSPRSLDDPTWLQLDVAGRLRDDVTITRARAQLESFWPGVVSATVPPQTVSDTREDLLLSRLDVQSVRRGTDQYLRDRYSSSLYSLLFLTVLVLLVICANLSSLMFARAIEQGHGMAIRAALGADQWQVSRQSLIECLALSFVAGVLGLLLSCWSTRALAEFILQNFIVPPALRIDPDLRVFLFVAALTILAGVFFNVPYSWQSVRKDPATLLRHHLPTAPSRQRLSTTLVVVQVALSTILITSAGLFAQNLWNLRSANIGFSTEDILIAKTYPVPGSQKLLTSGNRAYLSELVRQISSLPGVQSVSVSSMQPGSSSGWNETVSRAPSEAPSAEPFEVGVAMVSPSFFDTLRIPIIEGRDFSWEDDQNSPSVAILSRSLYQKLYSRQLAVGADFMLGKDRERRNVQIVGIVPDARILSIRDTRSLVVYVPLAQASFPFHSYNLEIRAGGQLHSLENPIRNRIESLGREYPLQMRPLSRVLDAALLQERLTVLLSSLLGGLAVLLALMGLYGLITYFVARRTKEIGVRMALGAEGWQISWMILRETLLVTFFGLAIGVPAAVATGRIIRTQIAGFSSSTYAVPILGALALFIPSLVAGYLATRRAVRVEPVVALRYE
jgi:putative ABC transport system permease protein